MGSAIVAETPEAAISELSPTEIAPLTLDAVASCPVTPPDGRRPVPDPGIRWPSAGNEIGNKNGTLFTRVSPGGAAVFTPNGPGSKNPDGSLGIKWGWYRTVPGDVTITGHRLDAPALPIPVVTLRGPEDGYGETGFHSGGILFPSEGCWEVTGRVGPETLTFVTLVVRLDFDLPVFFWWPGLGEVTRDIDLSGWPDSIRQVQEPPSGGEIAVLTSRIALDPLEFLLPESPQIPLVVHGYAGACVQQADDNDGASPVGIGVAAIQWSEGAISYRITQVGLPLSCIDLMRVAASSF